MYNDVEFLLALIQKKRNNFRYRAMDWTKAVTDPLGLAGFALAAVFALVSKVIAQKRRVTARWLVPASYALATICVVGGMVLAYRHESNLTAPLKTPISASPATSIQIGNVEQKVGNGSAVVGVHGSVVLNPPLADKESKLKQKAQ